MRKRELFGIVLKWEWEMMALNAFHLEYPIPIRFEHMNVGRHIGWNVILTFRSVYVIERFSLFTLKVVPITWHRLWVVHYFSIFFKFFAQFVKNFRYILFLTDWLLWFMWILVILTADDWNNYRYNKLWFCTSISISIFVWQHFNEIAKCFPLASLKCYVNVKTCFNLPKFQLINTVNIFSWEHGIRIREFSHTSTMLSKHCQRKTPKYHITSIYLKHVNKVTPQFLFNVYAFFL